MIDPYIDPSSGILINKVRATSQRELDQTEANLVSVRSVLLQRNPTQGNYDSVHLKDIHRYLFQDVYPFAGEFRSVELHKADVLTGRRRITTFTSPSLIDFELNQLFESVSNQHFFCRVYADENCRQNWLHSLPGSIVFILSGKATGARRDSSFGSCVVIWVTRCIGKL